MIDVDLSTKYLGLNLRNPLVLAASPLTATLSRLEQFAAAGVGAAVLTSIFEEQIREDPLSQLVPGLESASERLGQPMYAFRELGSFHAGIDSYLRQVEQAKNGSSIPIIGSINGSMSGDWVRFARLIQDAGADALELNIYFVPIDPECSSHQVEQQYIDLVAAVRAEIRIPLAVKVGPFFSSLPYIARRILAAGADGLVLFNRYLQPDIDLDTNEVVPHLVLSNRDESRLPIRWIGILRNQTTASLAATGGIQTAGDVLKAVLAGADVVMVASAFIRRGPSLVPEILDALSVLLQQKRVQTLSEVRGIASHHRCANPAAFERANYAKTLASFHDSSGN